MTQVSISAPLDKSLGLVRLLPEEVQALWPGHTQLHHFTSLISHPVPTFAAHMGMGQNPGTVP
jgi:hypothetical protein